MASAKRLKANKHVISSPSYGRGLRGMISAGLITMFTTLILVAFLAPFGYMSITSIKSKEQISTSARGSIWPSSEQFFEYQAEGETSSENFPLVKVPTENGLKEYALVQKGRQSSDFVDPENLAAGPFTLDLRWRSLEPVTKLDPQWGNFQEAWVGVNFPRLLFNTFAIAALGIIGTVVSCVLVAYGFARFPIPAKGAVFAVLIGTIVLPGQVTLVPTFALFSAIGWTGTWLPLIVPHFFSNAYNVFLLRQFFMTIPKELDEAAMIDGANPFQVLIQILLPQLWPGIVTIALFHLVFAWNDYFMPLIYLIGKDELLPIAVGIQKFNALFATQPQLIQATSLMTLVIPVLIFIFAQRIFMRGIVLTGVDR